MGRTSRHGLGCFRCTAETLFDTGDQLMLAAEQVERAGEVGVEVVLARCAGPAVRVQVGPGAGLVDITVHVVDQLIELVLGVADFDLAAPAVIELVLDGGEDVGCLRSLYDQSGALLAERPKWVRLPLLKKKVWKPVRSGSLTWLLM